MKRNRSPSHSSQRDSLRQPLANNCPGGGWRRKKRSLHFCRLADGASLCVKSFGTLISRENGFTFPLLSTELEIPEILFLKTGSPLSVRGFNKSLSFFSPPSSQVSRLRRRPIPSQASNSVCCPLAAAGERDTLENSATHRTPSGAVAWLGGSGERGEWRRERRERLLQMQLKAEKCCRYSATLFVFSSSLSRHKLCEF